MKKLVISGLLALLPGLMISQMLTLLDAETGQPIERATIMSEDPMVSTTTNARGQAKVSAFQGASAIHIASTGYDDLVLSFDQLREMDFVAILQPAQFSLEQVVVSASRWGQTSREVASRIAVISPKEVALQNPQTAADLLASSGEVFVQKSQLGGGSPMIRGFSTNRLLYTVDGVRMNTAIFRSGNLQNVISLDPFAIESTEILFGPGSVIYGSDAIGAVMSFQTLTPKLAIGEEPVVSGSAVSRYSSASNEKTGHFDINVGWEKWALLTSFSTFNFGDLRMGSHGPDEYLRSFYVQRQDSVDVVVANEDPLVQKPTGYSQINLMQKVRFRPNQNWDFQYGFHYSTTTAYPRYDRMIRLKNGRPRSAEWKYGPQVWLMNHLEITHSRGNLFYDQVSLRLAHQMFEESRIDRDFNKAIRAKRFEEVMALSANVDFTRSFGRSRLFYGVEAVSNEVNSTGLDENIATGKEVTGPARYPNSTWASYAAYLSYQFDLSATTKLQMGGRYNYYGLQADFSNNLAFYPFPFSEASLGAGALTGSLGAVYNPSANWTISGSVSTGFRAPNVDDVGKVFDSEPGSVVIPNPDLMAEYAYNVEAGMARIFWNALKIDVSAYYTLLQNALVRRNFTLNGQDSILYDGDLSQVQAVQNAAMATVYGVQAGFDVKLSAGFRFSSQVNYQVGEEELDDGTTSPSRHAAPLFGTARLHYEVQKLDMQFYTFYSAAKSFEELPTEERDKEYLYAVDANGNPYSPAWYTLNFKALYQLTDTFSVSAGVENLTDQRYRPYSSGIAGAGRNFILALRANF